MIKIFFKWRLKMKNLFILLAISITPSVNAFCPEIPDYKLIGGKVKDIFECSCPINEGNQTPICITDDAVWCKLSDILSEMSCYYTGPKKISCYYDGIGNSISDNQRQSNTECPLKTEK